MGLLLTSFCLVLHGGRRHNHRSQLAITRLSFEPRLVSLLASYTYFTKVIFMFDHLQYFGLLKIDQS